MEVRQPAPPVEQRPSLRPLAAVLGALAAIWFTAFGLILAQVA